MKLAILIASRNRPDLVDALVDYLARNVTVEHDVIVAEAGTDTDKLSRHSTLHYPDPELRGNVYAHNVALQHAIALGKQSGRPHDYYWCLSNDVTFDEGCDPARALIDVLEANPRMAVLAATSIESARPGDGWRPVTTWEERAPMIRAAIVDRVGFLNPAFLYGWGAIHELAYHCYKGGHFVACSDAVSYRHSGSEHHGAQGTGTTLPAEHERRAKRFAWTYFHRVYGPSWTQDFLALTAGHAIDQDTFARDEARWRTEVTAEEMAQLAAFPKPVAHEADAPASSRADVEAPGSPAETAAPQATSTPPAPDAPAGVNAPTEAPELRIDLGDDRPERPGWTRVDDSTDGLERFEDGSAAALEAHQRLQRWTLDDARSALREWRRVLAPGGELHVELPNLDACLRRVGTEVDGYDLGLVALFGHPDEVAAEGVSRQHKWAWTPETLRAELAAAGFEAVEEVPIEAGPTERAGVDMRLVARKPGASTEPTAATPVSSCAPAQDARTRVFAWPRWEAPALTSFLDRYGRAVAERDDVELHLRFDPAQDGPRDAALRALERAHANALGARTPLDVALVEGQLDAAAWSELGRTMDLQVASDGEPRAALRSMATPVVDDPERFERLLDEFAHARVDAADDPLLSVEAAGRIHAPLPAAAASPGRSLQAS